MAEQFGAGELMREFLDEAEEHFRVLNRDLLALEQAIESGDDLPTAMLDEMFRSMHTLKGLSAMFELTRIRELAHKIEAVYDQMRKGVFRPTRDCIDLLFSATDALQRSVAAIESGVPEDESLDEALDAVADFLACGTSESTATVVSGPAAPSVGEYAAERLSRAADEGLRAVRIRMRWGIELRLGTLRVRDVEAALGPGGEVLEIRPLLDEVAPLESVDPVMSDFAVEVLALSEWSDQEIADHLGVGIGAFGGDAAGQAAPGPRSGAPAVREATGEVPERVREAPIAARAANAVRVDIRRLDELVEITGELVTARTSLQELAARLLQRNRRDESVLALSQAVKQTSMLINGLQESVMGLRMVAIDHVFSKFPRVVRDLSRVSGKQIVLAIEGAETELDKRVIEQVEDPLLHILRNACDHGIEGPGERLAQGKPAVGTITLRARTEGDEVVVECSDDGAGLDIGKIVTRAVESGTLSVDETLTPERIAEIIMAPGFSTSDSITHVSGRGVGLDVVRRKTMDLGGRVEVTSAPGEGTTFTLRLPLTMAIIPALIVRASGQRYALPLSAVNGVTRPQPGAVMTVQGAEVMDINGETVPLLRLRDILRIDTDQPDARLFAVETSGGGHRFALGVDGLVGQQEIVVKTLDETVGDAEGVSGASILGDGTVVPILDVQGLVRLHERAQGQTAGDASCGGGA